MLRTLLIDADACYRLAEKRAADYFQLLYEQCENKAYIPTLTADIQSWKQNHIQHPILSFFSRKKGKTNDKSKSYDSYIKWLEYTGKLDGYLDRSISYLFMRDLGKSLGSPETEKRVQRVVESLKNRLTTKKADKLDSFEMAGLYRWAQSESIEPAMIWMLEKLRTVSSKIPDGMNAEHAQRKLIKIIAGVIMHVMEELEEDVPALERAQKLTEAIKLGYSYGLTYPFIDDLLDSNILSEHEKKMYSQIIRTTLTTGIVPDLGKGWAEKNISFIEYAHAELREAFQYIRNQQRPDTLKSFLEQSYVFFQSQEVDRLKNLEHSQYSNEELYIPIILKSSSSRLIVRSVINADEDEGFDKRTFYYGIYNQLADDFADMFDDMKEGAVTPYTYYLKHHTARPDLINPFQLYWTVISNLIHNVYGSNPKTKEVILDRAINGLKRFKEKMGKTEYNKVMQIFNAGDSNFNQLIQQMVGKADDVDFFDKLLRDHIITSLKNQRTDKEEFTQTVDEVRHRLNLIMKFTKDDQNLLLNDPIIKAANYSLSGDGKRLRPVIAWFMGVSIYGLKEIAIIPLLKSLEYMHTASLIFDDLPSQDNAPLRRGRLTLHKVYNVAIAELTGLFLTQKAIEEQSELDMFDSKTVLKLIQYTAQMTADMCKGQAMDLGSKGKQLTVAELEQMCFYKTGIAFEASLIMPAILAQVKDEEMETLKKFAHHAGIAFQIKDDLLDVEGEQLKLGKPVGKDTDNKNSTFVTILGIEEAKKHMWEHYCIAQETLSVIPHNTTFLTQLLTYMINRDH